MRILIDTHTFIWFFSDSPRLTTQAIDLIEFSTSIALVSIASIWENSIKYSKVRLNITGGLEPIPEILDTNDIDIVPINFLYTLKLNYLPFHHKDPFDRMIATQAIVDGINFVSVDDVFDSYFAETEVKRIW